jgi:hypothetical protein
MLEPSAFVCVVFLDLEDRAPDRAPKMLRFRPAYVHVSMCSTQGAMKRLLVHPDYGGMGASELRQECIFIPKHWRSHDVPASLHRAHIVPAAGSAAAGLLSC